MPNKNTSSSQKTSANTSASQQAGQSSSGVNTPSATSAHGQQGQRHQELKWRNNFAPGNQQGAMAQGGSSSTSTSQLGVGAGAGAYGSTMSANNFRFHSGGGEPANRGGQYGQPAAAQHAQVTSSGGNTLQSATSAPGQQPQYSQPLRWGPISTPGNPAGNYQSTMGQSSSSPASTSGLGAGAGRGANSSTTNTNNLRYRPYHSGGRAPFRSTRGTGRS